MGYSPKIDSHKVRGSQTAAQGCGRLRLRQSSGTPPHSSTTITLAMKYNPTNKATTPTTIPKAMNIFRFSEYFLAI